MTRTARTILLYVASIFLVVVAFQVVFGQALGPTEISLDEFNEHLESGHVSGEIVMKDRSNELTGTIDSGSEQFEFIVRYPAEFADNITIELQESGASFRVDSQAPTIFDYILTFIPYILIFGLFIFVFMRMQGGGQPNHAVRQIEGKAGHEGHAKGVVLRRSWSGRGC